MNPIRYLNKLLCKRLLNVKPVNHKVANCRYTCRTWQKQYSTTPTDEKGRLMIGFTCKKCNHRSHKFMSKKAYQSGVVIIQCPGCKSNHLIADHLGWFDTLNKVGTIEQLYDKLGRSSELSKIANSADLKDGLLEIDDKNELNKVKSALENEYKNHKPPNS